MITTANKVFMIKLLNSFINSYAIKKNIHTSLTRRAATVIDGNELAKDILSEVKNEVGEWISGGNKLPSLKILNIGDPSLNLYTQSTLKASRDVGIDVEVIPLPEDIREIELLADIRKLNDDHTVDGIIVKMPLPEHVCERVICNAVAPHKDVEGFNIVNVGRLVLNLHTIVPSTAAAIREIIRRSGINTSGKNAVICGRSHQVGTPIAMMLYGRAAGDFPGLNATTSVCHQYTSREQLAYLTKTADIVISCCGIPNLIESAMLKEGACVIDAGLSKIVDEKSGKDKIVGDVNFEEVSKVAGVITPVPGGVGPVSVAMIMTNILTLAKKKVVYDIFEPGAALNVAVSQQKP